MTARAAGRNQHRPGDRRRHHAGLAGEHDIAGELGARPLAGERQQHAHAVGERDQRRAAIGDERQRHALGRHQMQIDRHVDGRLQAEQDGQSGGGKTDERIVGAHRLDQRADDNEGKQRDQNEAEHDAEFLRRHRKDEIGVAFGQDALDGAFAGAAAEPAAADEGFGRDVDVVAVARGRIKEAVDALGDMRNGEERRHQADAGGAGEPHHPDQAHAGHIEQRAPHQRDQHGLAEIRLQHQQRDHDDEQSERDGIGRHFRPLRRFAEQPGDQDHESGLEKFRRLDVDAENDQPAPRALDLGAEIRRRGGQHQADDEDDQRHFADIARRQERGADQHRAGGNEKQHLAVDEMKRVKPDAGRDWRARGEAQHDAAEHQGDQRRQRQAVDRPPPFGKQRRLRARSHQRPEASPATSPRPSGDTGMVSKGLRKRLSRAIKLAVTPAAPAPGRGTRRRAPRNCGTGRTRRRPATAARPVRARPRLAASRAAAATALSSVPVIS